MRGSLLRIYLPSLLFIFLLIPFSTSYSDHLGSTTLVTNQSGDVIEEEFYLPYGEVYSGNESSRYLYTGQELDQNTDLYYYGARYYDPSKNQFVQPDPLIQDIYNPADLNRYAYVRNNPYKYTDPSGNEPINSDALMILNSGLRTDIAHAVIRDYRENFKTSNAEEFLIARTYDVLLKSSTDVQYGLFVENNRLFFGEGEQGSLINPSLEELQEIRKDTLYGTIDLGLSIASGTSSSSVIKGISYLNTGSTIFTGGGLVENVDSLSQLFNQENENKRQDTVEGKDNKNSKESSKKRDIFNRIKDILRGDKKDDK